MINNNYLIFFSILSVINIYIATNLSKKSIYTDNIFYHEEGTVCPFGIYAGQFMIASLEYAGEYNGEVTYSITLESSGDITFTSA